MEEEHGLAGQIHKIVEGNLITDDSPSLEAPAYYYSSERENH